MVTEDEELMPRGTGGTCGDLPATAVRVGADDALAHMTATFEAAAADPKVASRLAAAGVTVAVEFTDAPGAGMTLVLDRVPVTVCDGARADADVRLAMTARAAVDLFGTRPHLAMRILTGEATVSGPVRRFLRIVPVARAAQASGAVRVTA